MDWFLYDNGLHHKRTKEIHGTLFAEKYRWNPNHSIPEACGLARDTDQWIVILSITSIFRTIFWVKGHQWLPNHYVSGEHTLSHTYALSQYLGGDGLIHQAKCQIFKIFPGCHPRIGVPLGRQVNQSAMTCQSSKVNWQRCCADLKIFIPSWPLSVKNSYEIFH